MDDYLHTYLSEVKIGIGRRVKEHTVFSEEAKVLFDSQGFSASRLRDLITEAFIGDPHGLIVACEVGDEMEIFPHDVARYYTFLIATAEARRGKPLLSIFRKKKSFEINYALIAASCLGDLIRLEDASRCDDFSTKWHSKVKIR